MLSPLGDTTNETGVGIIAVRLPSTLRGSMIAPELLDASISSPRLTPQDLKRSSRPLLRSVMGIPRGKPVCWEMSMVYGETRNTVGIPIDTALLIS